MKVIIAGGRDISFNSSDMLDKITAQMPSITEVVCGGAQGVDHHGKYWAIHNNIPVKEFPADWQTHGKAAGPIRNRQMAEYADALILIWDGKSRGSKNMMANAKTQGLQIHEVVVPMVGAA